MFVSHDPQARQVRKPHAAHVVFESTLTADAVMSALKCGGLVLLNLMLPGRVGPGARASDCRAGARVLQGRQQLI
jgi:hypothetical protein